MLEAPLLGLILSYIIRYIVDPDSNIYIFRENDNIPIYIFMSLIVALFLGLMVSAEEIFRDRKILKREAFLNLSRSSYLISKVGILFLISAIQTMMFIFIANTVLGIKGMYLTYWFGLFTTAAFANMLGLNISASFNSAVTIYIVIPLLMIPMMVLSGAMFSFEKLNRTINSVGCTPLMAEFMPTKWSYEALMVNQFVHNEYAKVFFDINKQESVSDFKQVYYLPEIEKRLDNCYKEFQKSGKITTTANDLQLVQNELGIQFETVPDETFRIDSITAKAFTDELYLNAKNYIKKLQNYYSYLFMKVTEEKEDTIRYFTKKDAKAFNKMKDDYFNESIADIVTKAFEKNKILESKGYLIQNIDPIYLDPTPRNPLNFRSHFMASSKKFLGQTIDTYWFNMMFVWFYTIILYLTLYFEAIKRGLEFLANIKLKKK